MDHQDAFTTETAGLPEASSPSIVRLYDGNSFDLRVYPVRKRIGDAEVRMLGYNGSIPGPTLHVEFAHQDDGGPLHIHSVYRDPTREYGEQPAAG